MSEEDETERLLTPSLDDVRNHQIGKFLDYTLSISKSKKKKALFTIKTTTHPRWFEQKHTTVPGDIYLSKRAVDLLKRDGKVSKRWSRQRKWRVKKNSSGGKGEWYYRYRTPKKTNWIAGSKRTEEQKGKPGRKAGGMAYKVRREGWRILANKGHIAKLLEQSFLNPHERKPTQKFPLRIPDLSEAVEEIIIQEIWPKLAYHREHVVNEWLGVNGLRSFLQNNKADNEILEQFSKGVLEEFERNRIIHLICKRNWRAILARWIELKVFSENLWKEDHILIALSKSHDIQIEPQSETTKVLNKSIDFKCAPFCNKPEITYDDMRAEIWCANCGFIGGKISFSFNSITQEEICSYEYYDELEED